MIHIGKHVCEILSALLEMDLLSDAARVLQLLVDAASQSEAAVNRDGESVIEIQPKVAERLILQLYVVGVVTDNQHHHYILSYKEMPDVREPVAEIVQEYLKEKQNAECNSRVCSDNCKSVKR